MTTPAAHTPNASPSTLPRENAPEVIIVDCDSDEVCCDGGNDALGHPRVWYSFDGRDHVSCGYCDREFVKKQA